MLHVKVI